MKQFNPELVNLLEKSWTNKNGIDQKMVDHCLNSTEYVKIDDMWVGVCSKKPSIVKTIWYDDEGKDPGAGWNSFVNANQYNMIHPLDLRSRFGGSELYFIVNYWNDKTDGKLVGLTHDDGRLDSLIRKVTKDELKMINKIRAEVNADYMKRLETYFRKYNKNIVSSGFWVNR